MNGRRRIGKNTVYAANGSHAGGLDLRNGGIIADAERDHHAQPADGAPVGDLAGRQGAVGNHHPQTVSRVKLRMGQRDAAYNTLAAVGLDIVAHLKGLGRQDHQTAGHIAQHGLHRQRNAQRQDGQQRHQ